MEHESYQTRDERPQGHERYFIAPGRTVTYQGRMIPAGTEVAREQANLPEFLGRVIVEMRGQYQRREHVAGEDE